MVKPAVFLYLYARSFLYRLQHHAAEEKSGCARADPWQIRTHQWQSVCVVNADEEPALAYNKDNQEDKEPLFDSVDTLQDCLTALNGLIPNIVADEEQMRQSALAGFTTATDLADYLVRKNIPFRDAHELVGAAVQRAVELGSPLEALSLQQLNGADSGPITEDVYAILTLEGSVSARDHLGGTAPSQVKLQASAALERLQRSL